MSSPSVKQHPPGYLDEFCGVQLIAVAVTLIILEVIFATVRFAVQMRQGRKWGVDDWLMLPALLANICLCISGILMVHLAGVGYHIEKVNETPSKLGSFLKGHFAGIWIWGLATALPKLAMLAFYLRFFKSRSERITTYIIMLIIVLHYLIIGFANTFGCTPMSYRFDPVLASKVQCFNMRAFYRWMSFPNIVTDVMMLALPLPMVYRLNTTRSQKIGLGIIFATGGIGLITSCCRFGIFFGIDGHDDDTWTSVPYNIWTEVEPGVYFLAACMPAFPPLIHSLRSRFAKPSRSGAKNYPGHNNDIALHTIGGSNRFHDSVPLTPSNTRRAFSPMLEDEELALDTVVTNYDTGAFLSSVASGGVELAGSEFSRTSGSLRPPKKIRITKTITVQHGLLGSMDRF
ncbi:uncharacterized protein BO97DRAFT_421305 [Aspergillus homomorphus CBS 101889]|uniref:Rhodopsin domain-containing protein n=1 Tax=Aspergillus homomorphus (strain CBS 101889) TaxID=1450537 RepID=A0A395IAH4_ASPHC|nr:hypothetical protein BO97DRAFT_421305 [Aspergillus homomorphus CBS 101889]RAL16068.1 hypothetical protein BO97DRAFT_421305 [Aspergillus homomorphus CBS 101889]